MLIPPLLSKCHQGVDPTPDWFQGVDPTPVNEHSRVLISPLLSKCLQGVDPTPDWFHWYCTCVYTHDSGIYFPLPALGGPLLGLLLLRMLRPQGWLASSVDLWPFFLTFVASLLRIISTTDTIQLFPLMTAAAILVRQQL